jgi:hypothetical protein
MGELEQVMQQLGAAAQGAGAGGGGPQGAGGGGGPAESGAPSDEDIKDADFEVRK